MTTTYEECGTRSARTSVGWGCTRRATHCDPDGRTRCWQHAAADAVPIDEVPDPPVQPSALDMFGGGG